eukprot:5985821-Prymnesium_polylepis.1
MAEGGARAKPHRCWRSTLRPEGPMRAARCGRDRPAAAIPMRSPHTEGRCGSSPPGPGQTTGRCTAGGNGVGTAAAAPCRWAPG